MGIMDDMDNKMQDMNLDDKAKDEFRKLTDKEKNGDASEADKQRLNELREQGNNH